MIKSQKTTLIIGAGGVGRVVVHKCVQNAATFGRIVLASRRLESCVNIKNELPDAEIFVTALDAKGESNNTFRVFICKSEDLKDNEFSFNVDPIMLKSLIKGDYQVTASNKGISEFVGDAITYYIALGKNSTFA